MRHVDRILAKSSAESYLLLKVGSVVQKIWQGVKLWNKHIICDKLQPAWPLIDSVVLELIELITKQDLWYSKSLALPTETPLDWFVNP